MLREARVARLYNTNEVVPFLDVVKVKRAIRMTLSDTDTH
jgi:hypothetical protein